MPMSSKELRARYNSDSVSEDLYTELLIKAVEKRPVLYSVQSSEYNNKNKKGEAFKQIQIELLDLGCSQMQVQSIYKKWISLKRKFRVEYLRLQELDDLSAKSTFRYFDMLKFLIPYCSVQDTYKWKTDNTTLFDDALLDDDEDGNKMHIKDEEDIDDISLHLKKARSNFKSRDTNTDKLLTLISNSSVKRPLLSSSKKSVDSLATMISIQKQNMLHQQQPHLHNKCDNETYGDMDAEENEQNDVEQREDSVAGFCDVSTLSSSSRSPVVNEPISFACSSSSSNAVFGTLVATELDKLPPNLHNIVRAQILLLIAQASSNGNQNGSSVKQIMSNPINQWWPSF